MWVKYVKNIKITVYTSYMENLGWTILSVIGLFLSIISLCIVCCICTRTPTPHLLNDVVEYDEENMTWKEAE